MASNPRLGRRIMAGIKKRERPVRSECDTYREQVEEYEWFRGDKRSTNIPGLRSWLTLPWVGHAPLI